MKLQLRPEGSGIIVQTPNNDYAFHYVTADTIRGGVKKDVEGAVAYVGDTLSKHFVDSKDLSEVPEEVLDAVIAHGETILDPVEGGWQSWDGRPEFSTTYVDISDAEPVSATGGGVEQ